LKEFLEKNAEEVISMLKTELKIEDLIDVRYNDGIKIGREEGIERGIEKTARNALIKGLSIDVIHDITGLDTDTIRNLQYQG
jgi:predicted transposase YdaD